MVSDYWKKVQLFWVRCIHYLFLNEGFVTGLDDFLLFCYTDGLTETVNEADDEFGIERVLEYFNKPETFNKNLKVIHQDLIVALDNFKGKKGYFDDITILSCRVV
jgi:phosphoserine phosphatase RsbU/P